MEDKLDQAKKYYQETYFNREISERIRNGVHERIEGQQNSWNFTKKLSFISIAAVLLLSLLIGSVFVSPAMAKVASHIPYLSTFFKTKPVENLIDEKLKNDGYKISGMDFRVKNKTLTISISGTDQYYLSVKDQVKNIAENVLTAKKYDAYHVKTTMDSKRQSTSLNTRYKVAADAIRTINKKLDKENINVLSTRFALSSSKIMQFNINIPDTEKQTAEIKKVYSSILQTKAIGPYAIHFQTVDMKEKDQKDRWRPVINAIFDGLLAKKEYKVTGESYSFSSLTLTLKIKTSIQSSNPDAQELGNRIKQTIIDFIKSKEIEDKIKDDPYTIIVLSKDKKKINK